MASILDVIFARPVSVRIYGLGAVVLGLTGLVWGDFAVVWQPAVEWRSRKEPPWGMRWRSCLCWRDWQCNGNAPRRLGALALTVLYVWRYIFLDVPRGFAHPSMFVAWYGVLEHLALAAGALIICTYYARLEPATAERLSKIARLIFGICLIYFGLAHHFYLANTVSMVPAWLPPGQTFWAYATAAGHIAAGIAIISGIYAAPGRHVADGDVHRIRHPGARAQDHHGSPYSFQLGGERG